MTHSELVELARRFLFRKNPIVLTELTSIGECADAIGFSLGVSTVIECKTSLSDYYAESSKPFRAEPHNGMGDYRYYLAPRGLLKNVREGWGWLETDGRRIFKLRDASFFENSNKRQELTVLTSAMRRLGQSSPKGISIKAYYISSSDRATSTIELEEQEAKQNE